MDTRFAPAERASEEDLREAMDYAANNPVIRGLLHAASGLLAVLNEQRQILLVNQAFLEALGIADAREALGLRPGEALQCVHAHELAGGCGASRFCPTCGAAMAIVATLASERPEERLCVATVMRRGRKVDLSLRVRSSLIQFNGRRFVLLFLQDVTASHRWAEIERVFFHDLLNAIGSLQGAVDLLAGGTKDEAERRDLVRSIQEGVFQLGRDVALHKALLQEDLAAYQAHIRPAPLKRLIHDLRGLLASHPEAHGKRIVWPTQIPERWIQTDPSLAVRVLTNMMLNALEATRPGGEVLLRADLEAGWVVFRVWNDKAIPEAVIPRIFQRHFSTKPGDGRGLGTFSMKLLGEDMLGGTVDFTTSAAEGTEFRLRLPA